MKKILLSFILLFIVFFSLKKGIFAQSVVGQIPGVDCGMAGAQEGKDICCRTQTIDTSILSTAPIIGNNQAINQMTGLISQMQDFQKACLYGEPNSTNGNNCRCILSVSVTPAPAVARLCDQYLNHNPTEKQICVNCSNTGIWTALGCIPLQLNAFVSDFLLRFGIGLAGVTALLCIIYSAFQLQTSSGNPEKVKKAQELLTSCIMGLILIIFSLFILRLIGVNILKIPGFT